MGLLDDDEVLVTEPTPVESGVPPREMTDEEFEKSIAEEIAMIEKERAELQAEIRGDLEKIKVKKLQAKLQKP